MALAKVALDTARSLLNDPLGTLWTDAALLPFLQKAHTELVAKLAAEGMPVLKTETTVISVPPKTVNLSVLVGFPTDLIEPINMYERFPGETSDKFIEVVETNVIPNNAQANRLGYWCWESEQVKLLGALLATEVQLHYTKSLTTPNSSSSPLGFIFGELYIGPRTAAMAGGSVGNETGKAEWDSDASDGLEDVLAYNVKGLQNTPARSMGYHRRRFGSRTIRL